MIVWLAYIAPFASRQCLVAHAGWAFGTAQVFFLKNDCTRLRNRLVFSCLYYIRSRVQLTWLCEDLITHPSRAHITNHMKIAELWACNKWALLQYLKLTIIFNLDPRILDSGPHYARFRHHCRPHHYRICDNRQWCTLTVGYELENKKMIGAGLKPTVKDHITVGLWLEPAVFCGHSSLPVYAKNRQWLGSSLSVLAKNQRW